MKKEFLSYLNLFILLILISYLSTIPIYIFQIDFTKYGIIYNFIMNILLLVIVIIWYRKMYLNDLKTFKNNFKKYLIFSLISYIIGLSLMYFSNYLINIFFSSATANNDIAVRKEIDNHLLYMIFQACIYAPIVEELLFRKCLKDIVYSYGTNKLYKCLYVIISGLIFALAHVASSTNAIDYIYLIPYLSLGLSFSLVYMKTDNIYYSVFLHFFHNSITLVLYLLGAI